MEDLFCAAPFFWILTIGAIVVFAVISQQNREKQKAAWRRLAAAHKLEFVPNDNFFSRGGYVTGSYRGYPLKLETIEKSHGKSSVTYTRLEIFAHRRPAEQHTISFEEALDRFGFLSLPYELPGKIKAEPGCEPIYYEQQGVIQDVKFLESLINLLSSLAEAYPVVVAGGTEALPKLHPALGSEVLGEVASRLLRDIIEESARRLAHRAPWLLCPTCLTRFGPHTWEFSWWSSSTYYGCRTCRQNRKYLEGKVMAVLDSQMGAEPIQRDQEIRVSWSARRELFDFDAVEIIEATDEDVERFAVQVGNDTDPTRKPRYKAMQCVVSPGCGLSENTIRILEHTFGQIEVN
ncbi:MAG: hypothetical protein L6R45_27615 [Anaerolineae bacterium]|nr:hypothetical protein [Anaerolineae bacterium]